MSYVLFIFLFLSSASAALEKIHLKNLDLDYTVPYGTGIMEKLSIGVSTFNPADTYPIEVHRRGSTFEIISQFVDFEWLKPIKAIYDLEKLTTKGLSLDLDYKTAAMDAALLKVTPKVNQEFTLDQVSFLCEGVSLHKDPLKRMREDCVSSLTARASYVELPFEVMKKIGLELPNEETDSDLEMPASDFFLKVREGAVYSHVRIKYLIRAYLKIYGFATFENEGKTLAVRVDSVKFGAMPVTTIVMNVLRREIKDPHIKIDPPWVRIEVGAE